MYNVHYNKINLMQFYSLPALDPNLHKYKIYKLQYSLINDKNAHFNAFCKSLPICHFKIGNVILFCISKSKTNIFAYVKPNNGHINKSPFNMQLKMKNDVLSVLTSRHPFWEFIFMRWIIIIKSSLKVWTCIWLYCKADCFLI